MFFAVVPAAGQSTRMGRPKLELPWNGRTFLEQVVMSLCSGGVDHVVVVIGPNSPILSRLATNAGAHVCELTHPTNDMRESVECGLRWLENQLHPQPNDGWFLAPADLPIFGAEVIRQLCNDFRSQSSASILIPVHAGHRGHPTLISWQHVSALYAHPRGEGVNCFLRQHDNETTEVMVEDAGVLVDVDTVADFARLTD